MSECRVPDDCDAATWREGDVIVRQSRTLLELREARFSACGRYRLSLTISPYPDVGRLLGFVMLNASVADHRKNDPTVRRCLGFARAWGFAGIRIANLYAWRATDPDELLDQPEAVGPAGVDVSMAEIHGLRDDNRVSRIVCAWGGHEAARTRGPAVLAWLQGERFRRGHAELGHLGLTKTGAPRHPLYVAGAQPFIPYEGDAPVGGT